MMEVDMLRCEMTRLILCDVQSGDRRKQQRWKKTRGNPSIMRGNPFVKKLKSIRVPLNRVSPQTSGTRSRTNLTGSHEHSVISSSLAWKAAAASAGRSARSMLTTVSLALLYVNTPYVSQCFSLDCEVIQCFVATL